jgi:threonine 3-dehydrogenase
MRKEVVLITGASGEMGHGLIQYLGQQGNVSIVAMDVQPLPDSMKPYCERYIQGDILDGMLLGRLVVEFEIRTIYHLASILSTKAEYNPETAHRINVEGTMNLLRLAVEQSQWQGQPVKFLYPSSIAAYGLPSLAVKQQTPRVKENEWLMPTTMYGCNKLYCEHLGRYYTFHYRQLAADHSTSSVDFRSIRFPGLISAVTIPTGGTSDYGPEMLHAAAQRSPYTCFVRPDTRLPFMVMPDAIKSLLALEAVPRENLSQLIYNVTSFSLSAQEIFDIVLKTFTDAQVSFKPHPSRQGIVDTWPGDIDDSAACREDYLIPAIKQRYDYK